MTDNSLQCATERWFYEENGERKGGISETDFIDLIKSGQLSYGAVVWKQGLADWMKIENTDMKVHLEKVAPPPLSGAHINNTIIWLLAFAPFIGYFLEWVIAFSVNSSERGAERAMSEGSYFFITVLLNVGLAYLDEKNLKQSGHDTERFKGMTWLVPVYLFQRAKNLKHNKAYFATWVVCFLLVIAA